MKEIIVSEKAWRQQNILTKHIISKLLIKPGPQVMTLDYDFVCQYHNLNEHGESFNFIDLELRDETCNDEIISVICGENTLGTHTILSIDLSYCAEEIIPKILRQIVVTLANHEKMISALVIVCSERQFSQHLFEIISVFRILPLDLSSNDLKHIIHRQKALAFRAKYREVFLPIEKAKKLLRKCASKIIHLIR